jgi:hypothetical protein
MCRFQDTDVELEALLHRLQDVSATMQNNSSFKRLLRLVLDLTNGLNTRVSFGLLFGFRLSALQLQQPRQTEVEAAARRGSDIIPRSRTSLSSRLRLTLFCSVA